MMKESRNILGWLGMAEEISILQDAQKHVEETCQTVGYFAEAVSAFIKGDLNAKTVAIAKVNDSEHKADVLRAKMVQALSEGLLQPPDREELLHFVKTLDRVADWTNGAARLLGFLEERLPDNITKNMASAAELISRSTGKLKEAIIAVTRNELKKAIEDCEEVDRIEHYADDQKRLLIEAIIHAKLEPVSLLLTYQLAEYMESITDKLEDAADLVKVLAIRSTK
ncbi:MAG: DUF47 family protein [Lentisphaerota bacterium]